MHLRLIPLLLALALQHVSPGATDDPYARIEAALAWADSTRDRVYRAEVKPRWLPGDTRFHYEVATGPAPTDREFVLVDAATGATRRAATLAALDLPPTPEASTAPAPRADDHSPDQCWSVRLSAHNVTLRRLADSTDIPVTTDGTEDHPYVGPAFWSPDSRAFVLTRVRRVPVRQTTLVESSPRDQLQPRTRQIDYIKPGDPLPDPTPVLFKLPADDRPPSSASVTAHPADRALCPTFFTHDGGIAYRWSADGREVFFDYNQRGHQLFRLLALDAATAAVRTVVEDRSETFIDYTNKTWRHWLPGDRQRLWLNERDGFAHLWLHDVAADGAPPIQLTRGPWVVLGVEHVDAAHGQVWFMAGGVRPDEAPYHPHLCRVNLDGTGFVRLTEGDGVHRIARSPDRRWFLDTWSRVDHVDSASTLQAVDRLVRAGKPFELLLLPGVGRGAAKTPYGKRRRLEFFLRHLSPQ